MPDVPRLQPHQQATLREELSNPYYADMQADEAYWCVASGLTAKRLARTVYDWSEDLAAIPPEPKDEAARLRAEIKNRPGFPGKVRRSDFDLIWNKLRGS